MLTPKKVKVISRVGVTEADKRLEMSMSTRRQRHSGSWNPVEPPHYRHAEHNILGISMFSMFSANKHTKNNFIRQL